MNEFEFTPVNILAHMARELAIVVRREMEIDIPPTDHRGHYIRKHAKNIAPLLSHIFKLRTGLDAYACRLLVRPAMESQFCLMAAIADPGFVPTKLVAEIVKWKERLERMKTVDGVKPEAIAELDEQIALYDAEMKNIQSQYKLDTVKVRKWDSRQVAALGGCDGTYVNEYSMLSDQVHGGFLSLEPRTEHTRGFLLRSAAYVGMNSLFQYQAFLEPSKRADFLKQQRFYHDSIRKFELDDYRHIRWEDS